MLQATSGDQLHSTNVVIVNDLKLFPGDGPRLPFQEIQTYKGKYRNMSYNIPVQG